MTMCFLSRAKGIFRPTLRASYIHTEISDISTGLLNPHRNFGYLHGSLTPTHKFRIYPLVSYTHTNISDFSTGLLHPLRNSGYLHGSLTPHTEILDFSTGLLHPHSKFGISPRVSHTHIGPFEYYRGSPSH